MTTQQHTTELLQDPVALALLQSTIPARLAYIWPDGTPRVVPIRFHWSGDSFVLGTPTRAPKLKALRRNPHVALTIDDNTFPHKVLLVRGTARIEVIEGVVPEYALAAQRYFGEEQGRAWVEQLGGMLPQMARITIVPDQIRILDFQTRFPSALSSHCGLSVTAARSRQ